MVIIYMPGLLSIVLATIALSGATVLGEQWVSVDPTKKVVVVPAEPLWTDVVSKEVLANGARSILLFERGDVRWTGLTEAGGKQLVSWSDDARFVAIADMPDKGRYRLFILAADGRDQQVKHDVDLTSVYERALMIVPPAEARGKFTSGWLADIRFDGNVLRGNLHRVTKLVSVKLSFAVTLGNDLTTLQAVLVE